MTGQYYQQPPPQQQYGMTPPEADSIKSMVNIAGIFGILMMALGLILILVGLFISLFFVIWGVLPMIMGFLFFMNCKKINELVDQRQYEQAKSKTLIWMIIGIIFVYFIPGILLLIAYLKFDNLINASRVGHMPAPPQYGAPPPPQQQQRLCLGCGQQIPLNYNNCPHCGKTAEGQHGQQQAGTRMCLGCGQNIQANYNTCPHCGKPAGQQ